jgi:hypothetical protein
MATSAPHQIFTPYIVLPTSWTLQYLNTLLYPVKTLQYPYLNQISWHQELNLTTLNLNVLKPHRTNLAPPRSLHQPHSTNLSLTNLVIPTTKPCNTNLALSTKSCSTRPHSSKPHSTKPHSTKPHSSKPHSVKPCSTHSLLTGGSLVTDGRVTQVFQKEKMRSNNSNNGNYLLLRGILLKLMSSNVL